MNLVKELCSLQVWIHDHGYNSWSGWWHDIEEQKLKTVNNQIIDLKEKSYLLSIKPR